MNLLEDLLMLLLNFKSVLIHIIHKILVLIKNLMNYLQMLLFFVKNIFFDNI